MTTIGFIGGSSLPEDLNIGLELQDYAPAALYKGIYHGVGVVVVKRHGKHKTPAQLYPDGHKQNILALHEHHVDAIVSFDAVKLLDPNIHPGSDAFIIPDAYFSLFAPPITFGDRSRTMYPSMNRSVDENLFTRVSGAITAAGSIPLPEGLYITRAADALENELEISVIRELTAGQRRRLLGRSAGFETVLAAQLAVPYIAICSPIMYGEGVAVPPDIDAARKVLKGIEPKMGQIARHIVESFRHNPKTT